MIHMAMAWCADYDYATYAPGTLRLELTEALTKQALTDFRRYLVDSSRPCGKCRQRFGVKDK